MKLVLAIVSLLLMTVCAYAQEVVAVDPVTSFIAEYEWVIVLVIMIVEYLVGIAKIKSNSIIELVLNVLKMIAPKKA